MECSECGHVGSPEFGIYTIKEVLATVHMRCTQCQNWKGIFFPPEVVEAELRFPSFCRGGQAGIKHDPVRKRVYIHISSYSIYCPFCHWGHGGGLEERDAHRLMLLQRIQARVN